MGIIVDCHCHVGSGHDYAQTPADLVHEMEECGIDRAVICPADRFIAVNNREGNDYTLDVAATYPGLFYPFATANPWYEGQAVAELRRALASGARGIKLHPALQGFLLCDELAYPVADLAQELGVPVFVHTGTPPFAQPMQLAALAARFPGVNFIMGHMGSTDLWLDAIPAAIQAQNVYLDTSWSLPTKITRAVSDAGEDRVLFGTDSPLSRPELEIEAIRAANLDANAAEKVMGGNILALLGEA